MIKPDLKKGLDDKIENLFRREFIRKVGLGLVAISTIGLAELVLGNTNASAQSKEPIKLDMDQFQLDTTKTPNNPPAENYNQIKPTKDFYELTKSEIKGMSWSELKPYLNTPEKAYDFVVDYSGINYKGEEIVKNHLQTPEETLDLRTGNCKDYAYLIVDALDSNGIYAKMLTIYRKPNEKGETGHAVAVYFDYKTKEWYYIQPYGINNLKKGVSKEGYSDPDNLAKDIAIKMDVDFISYVIQEPEEFKKARGDI